MKSAVLHSGSQWCWRKNKPWHELPQENCLSILLFRNRYKNRGLCQAEQSIFQMRYWSCQLSWAFHCSRPLVSNQVVEEIWNVKEKTSSISGAQLVLGSTVRAVPKHDYNWLTVQQTPFKPGIKSPKSIINNYAVSILYVPKPTGDAPMSDVSDVSTPRVHEFSMLSAAVIDDANADVLHLCPSLQHSCTFTSFKPTTPISIATSPDSQETREGDTAEALTLQKVACGCLGNKKMMSQQV